MSPRQAIPLPVTSSLLESVAYNAEHRILELAFHSGAVYQYFHVPLSLYRQLMAADSKGRCFNQHIRRSFPHKLVNSRP